MRTYACGVCAKIAKLEVVEQVTTTQVASLHQVGTNHQKQKTKKQKIFSPPPIRLPPPRSSCSADCSPQPRRAARPIARSKAASPGRERTTRLVPPSSRAATSRLGILPIRRGRRMLRLGIRGQGEASSLPLTFKRGI